MTRARQGNPISCIMTPPCMLLGSLAHLDPQKDHLFSGFRPHRQSLHPADPIGQARIQSCQLPRLICPVALFPHKFLIEPGIELQLAGDTLPGNCTAMLSGGSPSRSLSGHTRLGRWRRRSEQSRPSQTPNAFALLGRQTARPVHRFASDRSRIPHRKRFAVR